MGVQDVASAPTGPTDAVGKCHGFLLTKFLWEPCDRKWSRHLLRPELKRATLL